MTASFVGTGMPMMDVRADFERARRAYLAARALRRLPFRRTGRAHPRSLDGVRALSWTGRRRRVIPLTAIVGTMDATADFDADFRPTTNRIAARWQRVALVHRSGNPLPPIDVIERPDGYYVLDGRHRVSVARALGHRDIDAWTSPAGPVVRARPPQTPADQQRSRPHLTHRLRVAVARALRQDHGDERVHFHSGDHGRLYRLRGPALQLTEPPHRAS